MYAEITVSEGMNLCRKCPKILVTVFNLADDDVNTGFQIMSGKESDGLFDDVKTVLLMSDDVNISRQMNLFTEKQNDIHNIKHIGRQKTILMEYKNKLTEFSVK